MGSHRDLSSQCSVCFCRTELTLSLVLTISDRFQSSACTAATAGARSAAHSAPSARASRSSAPSATWRFEDHPISAWPAGTGDTPATWWSGFGPRRCVPPGVGVTACLKALSELRDRGNCWTSPRIPWVPATSSPRSEAEHPFLPRRWCAPPGPRSTTAGVRPSLWFGRWWHGCCSRWVGTGVQSCVAKWKFSGRQAPASRAMLTSKVLSLTPGQRPFCCLYRAKVRLKGQSLEPKNSGQEFSWQWPLT